jgi:hypothetical protein
MIRGQAKQLAKQLHAYMEFRAEGEGAAHDFTPDFYEAALLKGVATFFGITVANGELQEDVQNPGAFEQWQRRRRRRGFPEVLTPDSPLWEAFVEQLEAAIDENGCAAGTNKDNAIAVMDRMDGVDINGSLAYFEDHGGYCDCEILMNVDPGFWDDAKPEPSNVIRLADLKPEGNA